MRPLGRSVCCTALLALLICAVALTAAGCGGEKQTKGEVIATYNQKLRDAVSTDVSDEGRKSQMLLIVDQLQALQLRFGEQTSRFIASYRELNADYTAARPAFDQLLSGYNAQRIRARNEVLDLHFRLASLATDDEWRSIGKAETNMFEDLEAARLTEADK